MIKEVRMNTLYTELYKSLKNNFIPYTIVLSLPSEKATDCAYNGMDYTINDVIKQLNQAKCNIKIDDSNHTQNFKNYQLIRDNNSIRHNINMRIYKINKNNQILFEVYVSRAFAL